LAEILGEIEFVEGDIRDAALLPEVVQQVDCILHHAAIVSVPASVEQPLVDQEVSAVGTLRLLEAARQAGVRRVVFASSAAVYGNNPQMPKREDMVPEPESPYAVSKVMGEHYARVYSRVYGLEVVGLRYFNVFGPRQVPSSPYSGVISIFVARMRAGASPTVFGDGHQSRDYVYVGDVVEANMRASTTPGVAGRIYNIGCGRSASLLELIAAINQILGTELVPIFAPPRAGDIRFSSADISRARAELGYEPRVGFAEGLERTIAAWENSNAAQQ
jgi:UDP-glucose 4-epimerase